MSNVTEVGSPLASLRGVPATVVGGYLGSGIGALEECTRLCVSERQPFVNLLIGQAFKILRMPLKTY